MSSHGSPKPFAVEDKNPFRTKNPAKKNLNEDTEGTAPSELLDRVRHHTHSQTAMDVGPTLT